MSNYRPWARNFTNPLERRRGESHSHHQYRTARYYVAVIVVIALALTAISSREVPLDNKQTCAGNVRFHARQTEGALHE